MAKRLPHPSCQSPRTRRVKGRRMPEFTVVPSIGRTPIDEIAADMVLMTKLYRQKFPAAAYVQNAQIVDCLSAEDFMGKDGEMHLMQWESDNGAERRDYMLIGLGSAYAYNRETSCRAFEMFFEEALRNGAETVLVPFIPNPMTKPALTQKVTAYKMKHALMRVLHAWTGPVSLKEVKVYCSSAAARHIGAGLLIEPAQSCSCEL